MCANRAAGVASIWLIDRPGRRKLTLIASHRVVGIRFGRRSVLPAPAHRQPARFPLSPAFRSAPVTMACAVSPGSVERRADGLADGASAWPKNPPPWPLSRAGAPKPPGWLDRWRPTSGPVGASTPSPRRTRSTSRPPIWSSLRTRRSRAAPGPAMLFTNRESAHRLTSALPVEINENCVEEQLYLDMVEL